MTVKAIFFDIDGTLVDSNDFHVLAWEEAFVSVDAGFDRQVIHDQIGKGTDMLVPTLLPDLDEKAVDALGETHGNIFKAKFLDRVRPFDKAHELLARVHADGMSVVFASSAGKSELDHYLDLLDAKDLVAASTSADDVANTKPAPDIFSVALKKIELAPDEVIVVGDTPYDMEAAGKCGITAVAVRSGGFPDKALRSAGAVEIYDDVAALLADFENSPLKG
ncbi:MAG: family hydrolase [Sphingomonadales bacterium]|nr:family hydrolase [Sphingomonadales bacterium]